jgi:putative salt-induced outer membrane protein YdiY
MPFDQMPAAGAPPALFLHPLHSRFVVIAIGIVWLACAPAALAQAPPQQQQTWTVIAGAGLALTSGNTDTSTVNMSYNVTYDPPTRNKVKSDGLLIRGKTEDELSADRIGLNLRDEFTINERAYVFGENRYLRDRFKNIEYLLAPSAGLGYRPFDTPELRMTIDLGIGGAWEKNSNEDVTASGALTIGERFEKALTGTATLTQSYSGLWQTDFIDNSLHVFNIAISAAISARTQLKVELLDTFKSRPPLDTIQKNDVAVLIQLAYSM